MILFVSLLVDYVFPMLPPKVQVPCLICQYLDQLPDVKFIKYSVNELNE